MTLRRAIGLSVAGLMVLVGALWVGQGVGAVGGSSMTGDDQWAIIGSVTAGLGVALAIVIIGNARRAGGTSELEKRYGGKR